MGRLHEEPSESATVRKIHALREAGQSLRSIVKALAQDGVLSRARTPLGLTQVARLARAA
jgi:hypothetical protein